MKEQSDYYLEGIEIENFKSYKYNQKIQIDNVSLLVGANSSGKSSVIQSLLLLKQTLESNNRDIDFLLMGKYETLGNFLEVINKNIKENTFRIGLKLKPQASQGEIQNDEKNVVYWEVQNDEEKYNSGKLKQIDILMGKRKVTFQNLKNNKYKILYDEKPTQYNICVSNLNLEKPSINYDKKFNKCFFDFYTEILLNLYGQKEFMMSKNGMAFINGFITLITKLVTDDHEVTTDLQNQNVNKKICNLINSYSEYQFPKYREYLKTYHKFDIDMLEFFLNGKKYDIEKMEECLNKYEKKLQFYKSKNDENSIEEESFEFESFTELFTNNQSSSEKLDDINFAIKLYKNLTKLINKIYYLGPLREKPQGLYNLEYETNPKYVGSSGQYFASVLMSEKDKTRRYIMPDGNEYEMKLGEALDEWMIHLDVASEINIDNENPFGMRVRISNMASEKADILNVGVGTSQVLPVLIMGLLSEEKEILLFEQPELHLHPKSQSRLADFFVQISKKNRQIIVETHSEYIINRLRYNVLKNEIPSDEVSINFFENKEATRVSLGNMTQYGELNYPEGFKDQTQIQINEILNEMMKKGGTICR